MIKKLTPMLIISLLLTILLTIFTTLDFLKDGGTVKFLIAAMWFIIFILRCVECAQRDKEV